MQKQWQLQSLPSAKEVTALALLLESPRLVAELLLQRGYTVTQALRFMAPSMGDLHDPMRMKGMKVAVRRIQDALAKQQHIRIYGDYDVDGVTSVTLLYQRLTTLGGHCSYYLPNREKEGYGLSAQGVQRAIAEGVDLLICIDCGTSAVTQVEIANKGGVEVIICDHHTPGEVLPAAMAILNPKQTDCAYPFKGLSACGIGFKLLQGLGYSLEKLKDDLDLVVLSIVADVVPMEDENRILAFHGMQQLQRTTKPGLHALLTTMKGVPLQSRDIAFSIAPRLNAAGRMGDATRALKLLMAENLEAAMPWVAELESANQARKACDQQMVEEAMEMIKTDPTHAKRTTTLLFNPKWHKGVVGIVAARTVERHYRPTLILTQQGKQVVGSARSVAEFPIYEVIEACAPLLSKYGGHAYAAGVSLPLENLPSFRARFEAEVAKRMSAEMLQPKLVIDLKVALSNLPKDLDTWLIKLAPFGSTHQAPLFISEGLRALRYAVYQERHLKLWIQEIGGTQVWEAIGFNRAEDLPLIQKKGSFVMAYRVESQHFRGKKQLQLHILALKASS